MDPSLELSPGRGALAWATRLEQVLGAKNRQIKATERGKQQFLPGKPRKVQFLLGTWIAGFRGFQLMEMSS